MFKVKLTIKGDFAKVEVTENKTGKTRVNFVDAIFGDIETMAKSKAEEMVRRWIAESEEEKVIEYIIS